MQGEVMWDGGDFRVCGRDLWTWGRTREEMKDMIADHGFTTYDSIHRIKINTQSK